MAERATVLEFALRKHAAPIPFDAEEIAPARLIPGSDSRLRVEQKPATFSEVSANADFSLKLCRKFASQLLPEPIKSLHPSMLGTAVLDLLLISMVFWIATKPITLHFTIFSSSAIGFYLLIFLFFAAQGELYRAKHRTIPAESFIIIKATFWTTALVGFALKSTSSQARLLPLLLVSGMSVCVLAAFRWFWSTVRGSNGALDQRNVLVVGDSKLGQKVAAAIRCDLRTNRWLRGFLREHQFRDHFGLVMLGRIARQECIDEVIVASNDVQVTESVIRAARRNQLDVRLALSVEVTGPPQVETFDSVALLKIHEQQLPQWQLAGKRIGDVILASTGLLVLAPFLLLIAAIIKLDSPGPILYRAERVGYRGHRFVCYKFRTMRPQADAEKNRLRSLNQRHGAFFKIVNDPRVTRVGRFLRRYSLDEFPQLWNVLRGEMSLVGPRPHPPDDVEAYCDEDMQRLDFVPGMTGLWQVTARQDPSFERSVALDVEYIARWSLLLDLSILCRTVGSVFQGSGV
jgi:exopolysaccharide biosynthesis polyprenyl glycosylphosphotransferase